MTNNKDNWPQKGDEYWYITEYGHVFSTRFYGIELENWHIAIGNIYKTKEEAEQALAAKINYYKVLAKIRELREEWEAENGEWDVDFLYRTFKYFIVLRDGREVDWWFSMHIHGRPLSHYLPSIECCERLIADQEEDGYDLKMFIERGNP